MNPRVLYELLCITRPYLDNIAFDVLLKGGDDQVSQLIQRIDDALAAYAAATTRKQHIVALTAPTKES